MCSISLANNPWKQAMRLLYRHKCFCCKKYACWVFSLCLVRSWSAESVMLHTKYKSSKDWSRQRDIKSCSNGMKCSENSSTPTSPKTPASSNILLHTRVRLGTQITENSCSILLFFCNRLICSVQQEMSASNDGARPIARAGKRYRSSWVRNGVMLGSRLIIKSRRESR